MRSTPVIVGFIVPAFIALTAIQGCIARKQYGRYAGGGYFFIINPDNTFQYRYYGHMVGDTSAGTYSLIDDTLHFNYHYNNYDSIIKESQKQNLPVPIDVMFSSSIKPARPKYATWKGKKLYPAYSLDQKIHRRLVLKQIKN